MIVGLPCPSWSEAASPPELTEDCVDLFSSACGEDRYVALGWTPETGKFRVVMETLETVVAEGCGLYFRDSAGSRALFGSGVEEFLLLDSARGLEISEVEAYSPGVAFF